jgi:hypothetical protein
MVMLADDPIGVKLRQVLRTADDLEDLSPHHVIRVVERPG